MDSKLTGGIGAITGAVAVAAIMGLTGDYSDREIVPTVETVLEAKEISAHIDTIPEQQDTSGRVLTAAREVSVPRKIEFPVVTVPSKGWFVFDADNYLPVTAVFTQGDVIIKKVIDPGIDFVREVGGAAMNVGINTIPLNGTVTRGVDSLKNEEL